MISRHRGTNCSEFGFDDPQRSLGPLAASNMVANAPPAILILKLLPWKSWSLPLTLFCELGFGPKLTLETSFGGPTPSHLISAAGRWGHHHLLIRTQWDWWCAAMNCCMMMAAKTEITGEWTWMDTAAAAVICCRPHTLSRARVNYWRTPFLTTSLQQLI